MRKEEKKKRGDRDPEGLYQDREGGKKKKEKGERALLPV